MDGTALYLDAPDGEQPEYDGRSLRVTLRGLFYGGAPYTLNARSGLFPISRTNHVGMSGGQVYVPPVCGIVEIGGPGPGPYLVQCDEHYYDPPPADSLPRIDSVVMRIWDVSRDDNVDGMAKFEIVYLTGVAGSNPTPPETPVNGHQLATISVPPSGSPTVTNTHLWTVANGGILPVRNSTELPPNRLIESMYVDRWDTNTLDRYNGSSWETVASAPAHRAASNLANWGAQHQAAQVRQTLETSFGNLSGGPVVNATIGESGACLINFGARYLFWNDVATGRLAQLRVAITGATTRNVGADNAEGRNMPTQFTQTLSAGIVVTGLNPGSHTFTLQYSQTSPNGCDWDARELNVIPLG